MSKKLQVADFSFPKLNNPEPETKAQISKKISDLIDYLRGDRPVWSVTPELYVIWEDQLGKFSRSDLMVAARLFLANTSDYPTVSAIRARIDSTPQYEHVAPETHQITRGPLPEWFDNSLGLTENLALKRAWEGKQ